jgi:glutaredoxin
MTTLLKVSAQDREKRRFVMKKVSMYSLSTCPWCKKAKKYFEDRRVEYDNVDYDLVDSEQQARVERDMRDMEAGGFPVVKIGRDVVVGYKPDEYEELLRLEKA